MSSYPSATNTFVPDHEATGGLIIGFSRNKKDFPVNSYIQIVPVQKMVGLYASYTSLQQVRIITDDDAEHLWNDGEAAPVGFDNLDSFTFLSYVTSRRAYPFTIGDIASDQAAWNIVAVESEARGTQAMTARTMLVQSALSNASWGSNTASVATITGVAGQYWDNTNSTPTQTAPWQQQPIYKCVQYASKQINLVTSGAVKPKNLSLVVNPTLGQAMGSSNELLEYIKQSPYALAAMVGDATWAHKQWDLPEKYHGYDFVVEDAVRVSSNKEAATLVQGYVMPGTVAFVLAFPAKLVGLAGSRSYSTVQCFFYKDEMTVETMYDSPNRRTTARVVSTYQPVVATTLSGFKITACLAPGS